MHVAGHTVAQHMPRDGFTIEPALKGAGRPQETSRLDDGLSVSRVAHHVVCAQHTVLWTDAVVEGEMCYLTCTAGKVTWQGPLPLTSHANLVPRLPINVMSTHTHLL